MAYNFRVSSFKVGLHICCCGKSKRKMFKKNCVYPKNKFKKN